MLFLPFLFRASAAPLEINGHRGNLAVVVRQEGKNYYKVHRILAPDGSLFEIQNERSITEPAGGAVKSSGLSPNSNTSNNSIPTDTAKSQEKFSGVDTTKSYSTGTKENTAESGVKYSIKETGDGLKYVVLDNDTFIDANGNTSTPRQAYNAIVGKSISFEDGDTITFIKRMPGNKDVYNELFRKLPAHNGIIAIWEINESINKNIADAIKASTISIRNEAQKHEHKGVKDFDKRNVYLTDGNVVYKLTFAIANLEDGTKAPYAKSYISLVPDFINKKIKEAETARKSQPESTSNNSIRQENENVNRKNSLRDYSYEALTAKPDMKVTTLSGNVPNNRADVVFEAKQNATKVGKFNTKDGSVSVYVDDVGTDVVLSTDGLRHGLHRTKDAAHEANYIVTLQAGNILKNSIKINELTPQH